jgi:hypothetical protein
MRHVLTKHKVRSKTQAENEVKEANPAVDFDALHREDVSRVSTGTVRRAQAEKLVAEAAAARRSAGCRKKGAKFDSFNYSPHSLCVENMVNLLFPT